jgi:hypothetical protein
MGVSSTGATRARTQISVGAGQPGRTAHRSTRRAYQHHPEPQCPQTVAAPPQPASGRKPPVDGSKTGARTVQLGRDAAALLAALKRGKPDDFVFAQASGRPVSLEKFWSGLRIEADLVGVRMHDLRHSYASQAARLSLPLPITKRLLGHRDTESTARYTHYDDRHLFEVVPPVWTVWRLG